MSSANSTIITPINFNFTYHFHSHLHILLDLNLIIIVILFPTITTLTTIFHLFSIIFNPIHFLLNLIPIHQFTTTIPNLGLNLLNLYLSLALNLSLTPVHFIRLHH